MSQPLRIEAPEFHSFITTRTRNSELWFTNQRIFEEKCLGFLAKYQNKYNVALYAFCFQGNHYHSLPHFPDGNRAAFQRDLNSIIARVANNNIPGRTRGSLWGRRYSEEKVPNPADIEKRFFYCALQPVRAGLCEHLSDYPGYNSFYDAISRRVRKFKVVDWATYNDRKRWNPKVKIKDFTTVHTLAYTRLPGYEHLSQKEYKKLMLEKLETERRKIVEERKKQGLGFLGKKALLKQQPGALPRSTKLSTRTSYRPIVLTECRKTKRRVLNWYFSIRAAYIEASRKFRAGMRDVIFPPQTYRPPSYAPSG